MQFGTFPSKGFESNWVKIDHVNGVFDVPEPCRSNGYCGNKSALDVIILGLVRQREFWTEDRKKVCESVDATVGHPTLAFRYPDGTTPHETIPCKECPFHKWQNGKPPLCSEQWVLPFIFAAKTLGGQVTHNKKVHYIKFTYSSIRKLQKYLTPFRDAQTPTYAEYCRITLTKASRDGNRFSIADFSGSWGHTPEGDWENFSSLLSTAREELLKTPTTTESLKSVAMPMGKKPPTQTFGTSTGVPTQHPF